MVVFRVGDDEVFAGEAGGHRWQRVPPTEKRGRVQTSTVTVAVMPEPTAFQFVVRDQDLEVSTCRGSGPGGQKRNKTETAVQIKHRPTGLLVRCDQERSQPQNRAMALALLRARLWALESARRGADEAEARRLQLGSGQRGDKRRTIRVRADQVVDHVTGRSWSYKAYVRGDWA